MGELVGNQTAPIRLIIIHDIHVLFAIKFHKNVSIIRLTGDRVFVRLKMLI